LPEGTEIHPDSTILSQSLPVSGEDWWQREASNNAPVIKMAQSGVDISRKAESLVRSGKLPKVSLQAGWTIDGPILVEAPPINRNLSYWYVGVGVSYNISSLYKNNKSLSRSRMATRKAEEQLAATYEDINIGVRADYTRYLEAYEELKTQRKSVELAERNYMTTATRYSADMALITDMLDAANSKLDAEQQLVNAKINIIYYYYKLLFTSGKI
ncbi:MAG: TolC family protein, partial [Duncaniella sp.]|nr:TolC family protein [Duncaniella sp.]